MKFTIGTSEEQYLQLFNEPVGTVFEVEQSDYETVMRRITEYLPMGKIFEVFPINPGTSLYVETGPGFCVVTKNNL